MKKLFLAFCLLASGDALAVNGNYLMEHLRADKLVKEGRANEGDFLDAGFASGFVAGAMFTLDNVDPKVCLPPGHNIGQLVAVTRRYFESNPAQLHRDAAVLVREAAIQAFPCKR